MNVSPVQTELAGSSQDVNHTFSPQLLAQDGGGDEAASSTNSSTAEKKLEGWRGGGWRKENGWNGVLISTDPTNRRMLNSPWGNQKVADCKWANVLLRERVPSCFYSKKNTAVKKIPLNWTVSPMHFIIGLLNQSLLNTYWMSLTRILICSYITYKLLSYLQWTIIGPLEGGASSRALSTSCTSSSRGGALSGVFWSGHEVYQYCRRLRSSPSHWCKHRVTWTHRQAYRHDI